MCDSRALYYQTQLKLRIDLIHFTFYEFKTTEVFIEDFCLTVFICLFLFIVFNNVRLHLQWFRLWETIFFIYSPVPRLFLS